MPMGSQTRKQRPVDLSPGFSTNRRHSTPIECSNLDKDEWVQCESSQTTLIPADTMEGRRPSSSSSSSWNGCSSLQGRPPSPPPVCSPDSCSPLVQLHLSQRSTIIHEEKKDEAVNRRDGKETGEHPLLGSSQRPTRKKYQSSLRSSTGSLHFGGKSTFLPFSSLNRADDAIGHQCRACNMNFTPIKRRAKPFRSPAMANWNALCSRDRGPASLPLVPREGEMSRIKKNHIRSIKGPAPNSFHSYVSCVSCGRDLSLYFSSSESMGDNFIRYEITETDTDVEVQRSISDGLRLNALRDARTSGCLAGNGTRDIENNFVDWKEENALKLMSELKKKEAEINTWKLKQVAKVRIETKEMERKMDKKREEAFCRLHKRISGIEMKADKKLQIERESVAKKLTHLTESMENISACRRLPRKLFCL